MPDKEEPEFATSVRTRWIPVLNQLKSHELYFGIRPGSIKHQLCAIATDAGVAIAKDINNNVDLAKDGYPYSPHETLRHLESACPEVFGEGGLINQVSTQYQEVLLERNNLLDARKQEHWATIKDQSLRLIFRTLTAIVFGAVVLGTGYFAKKWDIPIPVFGRSQSVN